MIYKCHKWWVFYICVTLLWGIWPRALSLLFTWPFHVSSTKLSPKLLLAWLGSEYHESRRSCTRVDQNWHMRNISQTTFTNTVSVRTLWSSDSTGIDATPDMFRPLEIRWRSSPAAHVSSGYIRPRPTSMAAPTDSLALVEQGKSLENANTFRK
jgi:hypothetical protein